MNALADYAYRKLDNSLAHAAAIAAHKNGELTGMGPVWACDQYGDVEHDYYTCQVCRIRYSRWLLRRSL